MNKVKQQEQKQLRVFGFGLPLICSFLAWRQYGKHGWNEWSIVFLIAAGVILGMALFVRPWLEWLFKYWMRAAHGIGSVITAVVLTTVYFFVMTPMAVVLRWKGKDYLRLQRKKETDSYWITREVKPADYTQQF